MLARSFLSLMLGLLSTFSCAISAAATVSYTPTLVKGWNLVGNSLATPLDVKTLLGTQSSGVVSVWKWNSATSKWAFYSPVLDTAGTLGSYTNAKGYEALTSINPGDGFWINVSADSGLVLSEQMGAGFALGASTLKPNWNLVATGNDSSPAVFSTMVGGVTTLWAWNNSGTPGWYFYAPSMTTDALASYIISKGYQNFGSNTLGNGRGFWVNYAGTGTGSGTGTLADLGDRNGIRLTIGGHTWVVEGAYTYVAGVPSGYRANYFDFKGTGYDTTLLHGITNRLMTEVLLQLPNNTTGPQACGGNTKFQIFGGGGATYTASACSVDVQYMTVNGGMSGIITSATLDDGAGNTLSIANAPFRMYQHKGAGAAKTTLASNALSSMFIDGGIFELPLGREFQLDQKARAYSSADGAMLRTNDGLQEDARLALYVQNHSFGSAGTKTCGTLTTAPFYRFNMQVWLGAYLREYNFYSSLTGGSCTVKLAAVQGNYYRGTYTATVIGDSGDAGTLLTDAQRKLDISGELRNYRMDAFVPGTGDDATAVANQTVLTVTDAGIPFVNAQRYVLEPNNTVVSESAGGFGMLSQWTNGMSSRWTSASKSDDNGFNMTIRNVPTAAGTYQCGTLAGSLRPEIYLDSDRGGNFRALRAGSLISGAACTITISSVTTTTITGTYSATLLDGDLATVSGGDATIGFAGAFTYARNAP